MTEKKLLSIIIPSRNRQKYAIHCIKSIFEIDDKRLEVVVHDNSDTNELELMIKESINDKRLIYRYDPTPMSTIHNFNKSMNFVHGEYICFIGDDDGINPEIVYAASWANENDIDAVVSKNRIGYLWPNKNRKGVQYIYPFSGKLKKVNVQNELNKFLKNGGVYYLNYDFPKVYHGIVKKECFDKVRESINSYFGGLSADIFASISLSLVTKIVVSIDYPLTIAGSSAASEQTHRTEEAKHLKLENAPHFRARGPYTWSEKVPAVYSGATIWAESGIKALEAFERNDLINKINKIKLAAHVALSSPHFQKKIINDYLENNNKLVFLFFVFKLILSFNELSTRIINRLWKIILNRKTEKFENIESINFAVIRLQKTLNDKKISIGKHLSKYNK